MQRVFSTTTTLLAGQIFTSTPFSVQQGFSVAQPLQMSAGAGPGSIENDTLTASVYSDQPGILIFQHSDNATNANFWESVACYSVAPLTLLSTQGVGVRKLYWRFIYQNTGTAQRLFELDINAFNGVAPATDMYGKQYAQGVDSYYAS